MNEERQTQVTSAYGSFTEQVDRVRNQFERSWKEGSRPKIGDYLTDSWTHREPDVLRQLLTELVIVDMNYRWMTAKHHSEKTHSPHEDTLFWYAELPNRPLLEDYVSQFPALGTLEDVSVPLIAEEFRVRQLYGDHPDREEFLRRFPNHRREIVQEFAWMEDTLAQEERTSEIPSESVEPLISTQAITTLRKLRDVAAGGLGQVSLARDVELRRKVALKEIRPKYAEHPECKSRFLLEAEITGRLEHPGIVPVYSVGKYVDGRPYYAMRYIRGEELDKAIKRFHSPEFSAALPGEWTLELQKLLRRFLDICNVVHYAHSRGILHRDLKPSNIMLGRYGETLVIDWGLAKVVDAEERRPSTEESILIPSPESGSSVTRMGSAIGTPAYMSPEQAAGDLDRLGPQSDIYSLGAILYFLLTGEPAFTSGRDIMERVKRGDFRPPCEIKPSTPRPLEAVCLKAMSENPEDRYFSPKALAKDVENWLADEPVSVHRETKSERIARWMRHHRVGVQSGIASLAAITIVLVVATVLITRAWNVASENKRQAVMRFRQAQEAVDKWLTGVESALRYHPVAHKTRERLLELAAEDYESFVRQHSGDVDLELERGRASLRLGDIRLLLGDTDRAEETYKEAKSLFGALGQQHPHNLDCQVASAKCDNNLGVLYMQMGRLPDADRAYDDSISQSRASAERFPKELPPQAVLAAALLNRGELLAETGKTVDAQTLLRECIDLFNRLVREAPGELKHRVSLASARDLLGRMLLDCGRYDEAVSELEEAVRVSRALADLEPGNPEYLESRAAGNIYLAKALRSLGHFEREADAYRQAIADYTALSQALPGAAIFPYSLSVTCTDLGNLLFVLGRVEEAKQELDRAEELLTGLGAPHSNVPEFLDAWACMRDVQGEIHRNQGRFEDARKVFEETIAIYESLIQRGEDSPDYAVPKYSQSLAIRLSHLGQTLHLAGEHEQADQTLQKAIDTLSSVIPQSPQLLDKMAFIHQHRANLLLDIGSRDRAILELGSARAEWEELASANRAAAEHRHHLAWFLANCTVPELRNPAKAVEIADRLVAEVEDNAVFRSTLGVAHYRNANWVLATSELEKAVGLRSTEHGLDRFFLAMARWQTGEKEAARDDYDRGLKWLESNLPHNLELRRVQREAAELLKLGNEGREGRKQETRSTKSETNPNLK